MAWHPIDNLRQNLRGLTDDPWRTALGLGLGAINPSVGVAGLGAFDAFREWNGERKLSNASDTLTDRMREQGDRAAQSAMDRPLNGPLGQYKDNSALASALSGRQADGGWNMSQAFGPQQSNWSQGNAGGLLNFLGQPNAGGPNLGGLDQALAAANGGSAPRSNGGMSGGGFGNFSGGNNWGGGFGGSMMSNLGMASGVQGFGGFGGSPTGMNNLDVNWLPG